MENHMEHNRAESLKELEALLARLNFSADRADLQEGMHWSVYAHPWLGEHDETFDALITLTPLTVAGETAEGYQLVVQRGNATWLPQGASDQRGQAWFLQLPTLGSFSARLRFHETDEWIDSEEGKAILLPAVSFSDTEESSFAHAAASFSDPKTLTQAIPEPLVFYLSDRRLMAVFEETPEGQVQITVETEAEEFREVTVTIQIRSDRKEVTLHEVTPQPADQPRLWRGTEIVQQRFQDIVAAIPSFAVTQSTDAQGKQ